MDSAPMDVDPIDDGPTGPLKAPHPMTMSQTSAAPAHITEEEEARQAIDMLRGDDVSGRVAAANRLEAVASVLGEERTREVCCFSCHQVRQVPVLFSLQVSLLL